MIVSCFASVSGFAGAAHPASPIPRSNAPAWVKPAKIDLNGKPPEGSASGGIFPLLTDEQAHVGEKSLFAHYARKFLSPSGVQEGSKITIAFDPAYETVTLNQLVVYRNGQPIDRLNTQEIKVIQREEGLDRHLYDGRLSAVLLLEDIRPGDVLEYAYTIQGENPIMYGHYVQGWSTRWSDPLLHLHYRLVCPADHKLQIKCHGPELPHTETSHDGLVEDEWDETDVPAVVSDGDLPSWYEPWGWIQITDFQTWRDVSEWAREFMPVASEVPDELRKEVAAIRLASGGDSKKQALAALRYVQSNIRYLGLEVGIHSNQPYPIDVVLQRRFGDCKDKALLLCAMIRQLGMDANPALVETNSRETIQDWLPTASAFNHAVVALDLNHHTYWLDPTRSNQGGTLDTLFFPAFGKALIVKQGTEALANIQPSGMADASEDITESYGFSDYTGEGTLNVHTVFHGRNADSMRGIIAESSPDELQKRFLNYYGTQYPDIQASAPPHFVDDLEKDELVCDESYTLSRFWQPHTDDDGYLYGTFFPQTVRDHVSKPENHLRTMPFSVPHPTHIAQTIRITFPDTKKFIDEERSVRDATFQFDYTRTIKIGEVDLRYSYQTLGDHVDAPRTSDYLKNVHSMLENLEYEISIPKSMTADAVPASRATSAPIAATPDVSVESTPSPELAPSVWRLGVAVFFALMTGIGALILFLARRRHPVPSAPIPFSSSSNGPLHRCARCGRTERSHGELEFRVARDGEEYCLEHLPARSPEKVAT